MFFIKKRIISEALYIKEHNATIRRTAKAFNISKSTVHKDITERLKLINHNLYLEIQTILKEHLKTRHLKGGEETRKKYQLLRT